MIPKTHPPENVPAIAPDALVWYTVRQRPGERFEGRVIGKPFEHACDGQDKPQLCYQIRPRLKGKATLAIIPAWRVTARGDWSQVEWRTFEKGQTIRYRNTAGGKKRKLLAVIIEGPINDRALRRCWKVQKPDGMVRLVRERLIL